MHVIGSKQNAFANAVPIRPMPVVSAAETSKRTNLENLNLTGELQDSV